MYYYQLKSLLKKPNVVESVRSYLQLIEKTTDNKVLINGIETEFETIEEARKYIRDDYNTHQLADKIAKDTYQDIATIEVEKDRNNKVQVQVVGNVYMYGENYIYEPVYVHNPVIYTSFWVNNYHPYYSNWYWNYYPSYYYAWNPFPIFRYRNNITKIRSLYDNIMVFRYDVPNCFFIVPKNKWYP